MAVRCCPLPHLPPSDMQLLLYFLIWSQRHQEILLVIGEWGNLQVWRRKREKGRIAPPAQLMVTRQNIGCVGCLHVEDFFTAATYGKRGPLYSHCSNIFTQIHLISACFKQAKGENWWPSFCSFWDCSSFSVPSNRYSLWSLKSCSSFSLVSQDCSYPPLSPGWCL